MTTWTEINKNTTTFTPVDRSDPSYDYTISTAVKYMPFIMQYSEDIVVNTPGTTWTAVDKS